MTDLAPVEALNLANESDNVIPWSRVREQFTAPSPPDRPGGYFPSYVITVRPDGRPHATGVGVRWYDGDLYFLSAPSNQKAQNLATNPACSIAVRLPDGLDVVFDGSAAPANDIATEDAVADLIRASGWPVERIEGGFNAPFGPHGGGAAPWLIYRFVIRKAIGQGNDGSARWRFDR